MIAVLGPLPEPLLHNSALARQLDLQRHQRCTLGATLAQAPQVRAEGKVRRRLCRALPASRVWESRPCALASCMRQLPALLRVPSLGAPPFCCRLQGLGPAALTPALTLRRELTAVDFQLADCVLRMLTPDPTERITARQVSSPAGEHAVCPTQRGEEDDELTRDLRAMRVRRCTAASPAQPRF